MMALNIEYFKVSVSFMLIVANKASMLRVVMLSALMLSVVAHVEQCRNT
jgi:hypothetical protein